MDYSKIIVPYISYGKIEEKVSQFRKKFWDQSIPVDIEEIADLQLGLFIIPIPEFRNKTGACAFISSDSKSIYVDKEVFENERYIKTLRFSLAHEIGHLILHKTIYTGFGVNNLEKYYKMLKDIPEEQYRFLESQANKFANCLLVPKDCFIKLAEEVIRSAPKNISKYLIKPDFMSKYLALSLSDTFLVPDTAVEIVSLSMVDDILE